MGILAYDSLSHHDFIQVGASFQKVQSRGLVKEPLASDEPSSGGLAMAYYERLSALDASFLEIEDENAHMHVAAVLIFDGGPIRTAYGDGRAGSSRADV